MLALTCMGRMRRVAAYCFDECEFSDKAYLGRVYGISA
jgi:hypothetical protein